ncbi:hypothetical protein Bca4012_033975 [Brassica carinata]
MIELDSQSHMKVTISIVEEYLTRIVSAALSEVGCHLPCVELFHPEAKARALDEEFDKCPPLEAPSPMCPPEPPDPPDVLALNAPLRFCDTSSRPSLQALFQTSTVKLPCRIATKSGGGGGAHVFASDTLLAYGLLSPVVYRSIFGCVDWSLFSSCFDLPITPPCKVSHVHLSSFFSTYFATVEWIRQLFVWVTLELRFMTLVGDIPMVLVLFGPTLATSNSIFIALARSSAVCSSLTGSIPGVGVMFVYLSSWWQVEEKLIFIFSLMNMDVAGYDFSFVPRLNQFSFLILPPIWSELEEQASLVLQGSSSHRMLFSAYGAVLGVRSVVLEQAKSLRTGGTSLTLFKNGWRVLDAISVGPQLRTQFLEIEGQEVRAVERRVLLETLASQLPPETIKFSSKLKTIQSNANGDTQLELEDGSKLLAKIVIACDGIRSKVAT